jgi:hypothetical protein
MPTPAIQAIIQGAPIRVEMKAPQGPGGKSAYQVAVENGFVGTEAQWLASLVGPNTVTSATTTNFTSGNVLFANSGFVGSVSRSGIDTRTSFPNDDVAAATPNSTAETIVKRDSDGAISLASSNTEGITLSVSNSGNADNTNARAIQAVATGTAGIAGEFTSTSGRAIIATSDSSTALEVRSKDGTYHATFGTSGNNRSAVERVRGWFVWFYANFTGRLKTANITANRDWTLPDASGTIALTSDIVDSVTSATTSDGTANLSISNVTTATATVSSLLTANHIHGNIAGTLYTHVRTGEAVSKGDPVYVSGFHNGTGQAIVMKADASDAGKMPAIGVMDAAYAQNVSGANCVIAGTITSVDTDDFSINSPVYVGNGGGFSETIGTIPQQVGIVERSNTNNGAFVVTNNKVISSADISDFTTAVEAIAPNAVTSATTSDGTASLDISNLTLSEAITSGLQTKMTFTANPTAVGDGQQIIWQWYNGGSPITTAAISSEATGSTTDKLIFKTTAGGSLSASLDLTNTLATFSGAIAAADSITIDGVEVAKVVDPVRTTLTGNGSTSVYAIGGASGLTNPSALVVAIDGVLQEPTVDYGVGSGNITFTSPLPNGSKAVVISPTNTIQVGQVTPSDGSVTSSKIASGVTLVSPTITGPANLTSQDSSTADRVMNRDLSDTRVIKNRVEGKARVFTLMNTPNALVGSVNQLTFPSFVEMAITAANTHSGFLFCDLNPHNDWSGAGFNFARNFLCSGVFYLRAIGDQNGSLRFFIGTPAFYRSNQAALATPGLCLEFRRNGSNLQARLAYYATTYIETAWVTAYATSTYFNSVFRFVVRNTGNGNVDVYFLAGGDTGSTKPLPDIDGTPLISVTNGPTISGGRSLVAAFCADTTLTPTANNQARVQHFDVELLS